MITNAIVKRIMGVCMIKTPLMSVAIFWERHVIKSVPKKIHAVIFFLKHLFS